MRAVICAVVAVAGLAAFNTAWSQELVEVLRKSNMGVLGRDGTPARVEIQGDRLVIELPPPPPPRIEIPIRQVQCQGTELSEYFFLKCYSGKCMNLSRDGMKFESEIHALTLPGNLAVAAAAACVKLQNSLGGVITK